MRRRMYCLLPDVTRTRALVAELKEAGLSDRHIHVLAAEDVRIDGLHKAGVLQTTELARGMRMGLAVGAAAGMLGGLLAVAVPPVGIVFAEPSLLLATTFAGAGFGGLVTALVAGGIPRRDVRAFQSRILMGELLVMLDIPTHRIPMTGQMIERLDPQAKIGLARDGRDC